MTIYGRSKSEKDDEGVPLFKNVKYYLHGTLSFNKKNKLDNILQDGGAEKIEDQDEATHIFSIRHLGLPNDDSPDPPYVVTPLWAERAVSLGYVHEPKYYSANPVHLFSGMGVTTHGLPKNDDIAIMAAMQKLGGQNVQKLSEETTHLVVASDNGKTVHKALEHYKIPVVTTHFIDDCVNLKRRVREDLYTFPNPKILDSFDKVITRENNDYANAKEEAYKTIGGESLIFPPYGSKFSLQGPYKVELPEDIPAPYLADDCIYVEPDLLGVDTDVLDSWLTYLEKKAGAEIVKEYNKDKVTIAVVKHRSTPTYVEASRDGKMVASKWWLTNTIMRKQKQLPTATLVDYPMPKGGIPGADKVIITISGYKDTARDYLRRLAIHCGMIFTYDMTNQTTHLVINSQTLPKWKRAKKRNISVVNHIWLEECFRDWIIYSVADRRFNHFPGGPILRGLVGKTELIPETLSRWWKDENLYPEEINRLPAKEYAKSINLPTEKRDAFTGKRAAATKANELVRGSAEDMNAYAKEKRRKTAQSTSDGTSTTTTITEEEELREDDDDTTATTKDNVDQEHGHTEEDGEEAERPYNNGSNSTSVAGDHKGRHKRDYRSKESDEEDRDHAESSNMAGTRGKKRQKNTDSTDESDGGNDNTTNQPQKKSGTKKSTQPLYMSSSSTSRNTSKQSTKNLTNESTSKSTEKPVLLFTGFTDKLTKEKREIRKLGVTLTEDVYKATHLVANGKILRTAKFLSAVNLGLKITTKEWLDASIKGGDLLDAEEFPLVDEANEKELGCNLRESLEKVRKGRQATDPPSKKGTLFQGYKFYFLGSTKETIQLEQIVESGGGQVVYSVDHLDESNYFIISSPGSTDNEKKLSSHNKEVHSKDVVTLGSLRQSFDNFDQYRL
ncbi:hypothetical protein BDC45DRAFT_569512 [Circinella umbellata]|nr:hypothetical protein BDC45DRAFT_569512 [Circinella umbellata]